MVPLDVGRRLQAAADLGRNRGAESSRTDGVVESRASTSARGFRWIVDHAALIPYHPINVDYRLAKIAPAPAAVEDARCALRWVISNAKQYGIDPARLVLAGGSAGAHLALLAAMLPQAEGFDRLCFGPDNLKVAAVVSWYGVTDLVEMMDLPSLPAATIWLGSNRDREQLAKRISPLTYVRPGLPPMFLLHSVTDPIAPYSQSVRLHEALDKVGVANELLTIPGGRHGYLCCTLTERLDAYHKIREFLTRHRVIGSSN